MSDFTRAEYIQALVDGYRPLLSLRDWDIRFDPDLKVGQGFLAEVTPHIENQIAVVAVHPDVAVQDLEGVVLHELLHLVLKPYTVQSERALALIADDRVRDLIADLYLDAEEAVVNTIVRAFGESSAAVIPEMLPIWAAFKSAPPAHEHLVVKFDGHEPQIH